MKNKVYMNNFFFGNVCCTVKLTISVKQSFLSKKGKKFLTHIGQQDVVSYLSFVCLIKFPCFRFKEANCTA